MSFLFASTLKTALIITQWLRTQRSVCSEHSPSRSVGSVAPSEQFPWKWEVWPDPFWLAVDAMPSTPFSFFDEDGTKGRKKYFDAGCSSAQCLVLNIKSSWSNFESFNRVLDAEMWYLRKMNIQIKQLNNNGHCSLKHNMEYCVQYNDDYILCMKANPWTSFSPYVCHSWVKGTIQTAWLYIAVRQQLCFYVGFQEPGNLLRVNDVDAD